MVFKILNSFRGKNRLDLNYTKLAYGDRLRMYEQAKQTFIFNHPEATHKEYEAEMFRLARLLKI